MLEVHLTSRVVDVRQRLTAVHALWVREDRAMTPGTLLRGSIQLGRVIADDAVPIWVLELLRTLSETSGALVTIPRTAIAVRAVDTWPMHHLVEIDVAFTTLVARVRDHQYAHPFVFTGFVVGSSSLTESLI